MAIRSLPDGYLWHDISTAPFGRDLELGEMVPDGITTHPVACRRILGGWVDAKTRKRVDISPTHWRDWRASETTH